jgi:hypothetical protein
MRVASGSVDRRTRTRCACAREIDRGDEVRVLHQQARAHGVSSSTNLHRVVEIAALGARDHVREPSRKETSHRLSSKSCRDQQAAASCVERDGEGLDEGRLPLPVRGVAERRAIAGREVRRAPPPAARRSMIQARRFAKSQATRPRARERRTLADAGQLLEQVAREAGSARRTTLSPPRRR